VNTTSDKQTDNCPQILERATLLSPAKLNLGLRIVGRTMDGYHQIESLFWPITLCDKLEIVRADDTTVEAVQADPNAASFCPIPSDQNLVTKALNRFAGKENWRVRIEKRIPQGAGLGGGSSNAGTTLRFLQNSGRCRMDPETAASIGADVPFFLNPRPSWVTGIGELCQPIDFEPQVLNSLLFLLALPPISISTRDVFAGYRLSSFPFSTSRLPFPRSRPNLGNLCSYLQTAWNDLEPVVRNLYPTIGRTIDSLRQFPCLYAGLSGSGSTCFAVFLREELHGEIVKDFSLVLRNLGCQSVWVESFIDACGPKDGAQGEHHGNHRGEGFSR